MKRKIAIPLIIAGGLIAGGYAISLMLPSDKAPQPQADHAAPSSPLPVAGAPTSAIQPQSDAAQAPEPQQATTDPDASWNGADYAQVLAGTQIDGELKADENGNLVTALAVKDFFDYFLSAVGEVSPEQAIEEIRRQAKMRVPEPAATQVMELLADYVTYQHLMQDFMQKPLAPADQQDYQYYAKTLKESFDRIKDLRRQVFTPEAVEAFFGLDEAYAQYAVASIQVKADDTLTDAQKEEKMEELKKLLPEQMRIADIESRERSKAVQNARDLWDKGQGDAVVRDALRKQFDEETINSTIEYFKRESAWNTKLEGYLSQRKEILDGKLSDDAKNAQIDQLRQTVFQQQDERMRAEAHERIEAENARLAALTEAEKSASN